MEHSDMTPTNPKECRYFSIYESGCGVTMMCAKHRSIYPKCTWGKKDCPDFTPKTEKDNGNE